MNAAPKPARMSQRASTSDIPLDDKRYYRLQVFEKCHLGRRTINRQAAKTRMNARSCTVIRKVIHRKCGHPCFASACARPLHKYSIAAPDDKVKTD
jgi:hypothetical protein